GGGAAGIWKGPGAEADGGCLPGEPAEHRGGVRAIRLGGPHGVVAQTLGLLDDFQLILRGEAEATIADVHAELHVQVSFQRKGFVAGARCASYPWPRICRRRRARAASQHPMANRRRSSSRVVEA